MTEIDIEVNVGKVIPITVLDTTVSESIASGVVCLAGWSLRTTSTQVTVENEGQANAPLAGTSLLGLVLTQGEWVITWTVEVDGTTAAAEDNNFELVQDANVLLTSLNGHVAGQPYQQVSVTVSVGAGGSVMHVKNINAGTAASVYLADIAASPVGTVAVAEITSGGNPVAEISIPVGATDTQWMSDGGIRLPSDLTLSVLSGSFRGAVYARLHY